MAKLPKKERFLDFSDYGRSLAVKFAELLLPTGLGAISITWMFTFVGIVAALLIYLDQPVIAALLLPVKSMLDAADGEMARLRKKPSYVGRYLDSVNDFLINAILIFTLMHKCNQSYVLAFAALVLMELQGSVFNYYYLVKRYKCDGDKTSRINESSKPEPFPWDNKNALTTLHFLYKVIYRWQDKIIWFLDKKADQAENLPKWFMSLVSVLGLGFQLLVMALFLIAGYSELIIPVFIFPYTVYGILVIVIRKVFIK
ncbi:MAG: CDP-alcohol phosphatidyltransferase family protein [Melioribacteraceae bacterium]|nr:CDP-alcohol phosphatidyltransferase family protein [Melioribacteraceae bacterium]